MESAYRLLLLACVAGVGYGVGWAGAALPHLMPESRNYPFLVEEVPLPHGVPEYRGGVSLRFAMVHDVIHERFAKHGPAYYRERDRLARDKLAALTAGDPARFPLLDDLATDLERLGKSDEAAAAMRAKLADQQTRGISGRDLYTSYANLGTFLIHASFPKALAGDPDARGRFQEGVEFIRKSVEVNPEAHFGRERWQASIAEFLLAAMADPGLLKTFDCLGNRLDRKWSAIRDEDAVYSTTGHGRPTDLSFRGDEEAFHAVPAFFEPDAPIEVPARWGDYKEIRKYIAKVGAEEGWDKVEIPSHRGPTPFDEPVLGIIGMWRQGGGANPHFALALGETMLRVGQRYIAWVAFERSSQLAERYWPDPALQQALRDHCRARQAEIEADLTSGPVAPGEAPADPKVVARLRPDFEKELALGLGYQEAYREYEAARIAAGKSIDDPRFFDDFDAAKGPIASPTGTEEWFPRVPRSKIRAHAARSRQAWGLFGAGSAAMLLALASRLRRRLKAVPA